MPDLLTTSSFFVEIDGVTVAQFKEASGIDSETTVIEYKEVTDNGTLLIRKVPGAPKWQDLVLKRRIDDSLSLWEWRKEVLEGDIESARRNGSLVLYNSMGEEAARWNFENGWPSHWKGSDFNAGEDEIAVEEITISHEGLERA